MAATSSRPTVIESRIAVSVSRQKVLKLRTALNIFPLFRIETSGYDSRHMMPAEHKDKLTKAAKLLADVQQDMSKRHDRGSNEYIHTWQDLYWLREKLDDLIRYGFVLYHGDLPAVRTSA